MCAACGSSTNDRPAVDARPAAGDAAAGPDAAVGPADAAPPDARPFELEDNNSLAAANLIDIAGDGAAAVQGAIRPEGDVDFYAVVIPEARTGKLTAEVSAVSGDACFVDLDSELSIFDAAGREVARDDDSGAGTCSLVTAAGLAPGRAHVRVVVSRVGPPATTFDYRLTLRLELSPCGDRVLQEGQECDDGNTNPGDGCSGACRLEDGAETEPNNSPDAAGAARVPPFAAVGAASPVMPGDVDLDWFAVSLASATQLRVLTQDDARPADCSTLRADVALYDGAGELLELGDAGDGAICSDLTSELLAPGSYRVLVRSRPAPEKYRLLVLPVP